MSGVLVGFLPYLPCDPFLWCTVLAPVCYRFSLYCGRDSFAFADPRVCFIGLVSGERENLLNIVHSK